MFRDEYTNFSFNDLESENFKVWITNKNDLTRSMSPNFSDKFNTPTGSQIRYHEGTTIDKQDFKLSCAAVDVTLNEWRAITEWLSPLKSGKLRFEWNDKYYYMVKVSKAPTGSMFMKGRIDDIMGQLYIITFDLEFTTIHDWAALGNYAEQNSAQNINPSVYNNEYCMPSIITRQQSTYRVNLGTQTMFPSGDIVIVTGGEYSKDFIYLPKDDEDSVNGIKEVLWNRYNIPTKIVFKWGYAPVIKCWDFESNAFSKNNIVVCALDLDSIKDLDISVKNEDFSIVYHAKYNELKEIELELELDGVIDDYSGLFILMDVIDKSSGAYKYPEPTISITDYPRSGAYPGIRYAAEATTKNTYNDIKWEVTFGSNADTNEKIEVVQGNNICTFKIPYDYGSALFVGVRASVNDYEMDENGEVKERIIYDQQLVAINEPAIDILSTDIVIGIADEVVVESVLYGFENPVASNIIWSLDSDKATIVEGYKNGYSTKIKGLRHTSEDKVTLTAEYTHKVTINGKTEEKTISDSIGIQILPNQIIVTRKDGVSIENNAEIELGNCLDYNIDVIGEPSKGYVTVEGLDSSYYILARNEISGDYTLRIKAPESFEDDRNFEEKTITVARYNDDGSYMGDLYNTHKELVIIFYKGAELQNINSIYVLSEGNNIVCENCLKLNYFENKNVVVEMFIDRDDICSLDLQYSDKEEAYRLILTPLTVSNDVTVLNLTCNILSERGEILDSLTYQITYSQNYVCTWDDTKIITHDKQKYTMHQIQDKMSSILNIYQDCSARVILDKEGLFNIAYVQEFYDVEIVNGSKEKTNKRFGVYNNFYDLIEKEWHNILLEGISHDVFITKRTEVDGRISLEYRIPKEEYRTISDVTLTNFLDWIFEGSVDSNYLNIDTTNVSEELEEIEVQLSSFAITGLKLIPSSNSFIELQYGNQVEKINFDDINWTSRDLLKFKIPCKKGENLLIGGLYYPYFYAYSLGEELQYFNSIFKIKNINRVDVPTGEGDSITWNPFNDVNFEFSYCNSAIVEHFKDNTSWEYTSVGPISVSLPVGYKDLVQYSYTISNSNFVPTPNDEKSITQYIYGTSATPSAAPSKARMFMMNRSFSVRNNSNNFENISFTPILPGDSSGQFVIVDMQNTTVGVVYILNGIAYHRHYFNGGTDDEACWDEIVGTEDYYEFKSHPSLSLISYEVDSTKKLLLKSNSNTVICNTGVFNMYPLFFIQGGCRIKDDLMDYYSFDTNTNVNNLFVTINSRTSTMLHNGYTIGGSYNRYGVPLFKNIKNNNQLYIPSGRAELLKAILVNDEEIVYGTDKKPTGRRKATFLINQKPVYGRRDRFAVHIFNKDFYIDSNTYNKDKYGSEIYYNQSEAKHLLLDSPIIEYEQTDRGWKMYISYRAYSKGLNNEVYYDFNRGDEMDQYSNISMLSSFLPLEDISVEDRTIYISLCDYKELDVKSEGENYIVGCQSRGVI